jgi:hypothetical protein
MLLLLVVVVVRGWTHKTATACAASTTVPCRDSLKGRLGGEIQVVSCWPPLQHCVHLLCVPCLTPTTLLL